MSYAHGFEKENALLLAASRVRAEAVIPTGTLDWGYLARAADRQGVTPLLHDWLQRHPDIIVDERWAQRLFDGYWASHFRNRLLLSELRRVLRVAAEAGIDLMPLKGARLALDYYPAPVLRPLSDLDLLVHPADADRLGRVLRDLCYQEVDPLPSYVPDRWLENDSRDWCWFATLDGLDALIEYRTAPLELAVGRLTDLDSTCVDALRQHAATVWARARTVPDGKTPGTRMAPEDLLLHVATHLSAKHVEFRLIWLHDIARIVMATPGLDWDHVAETATRLRVAAPVTAALLAAVRWIGAPITAGQLDRVRAGMTKRSPVALERWDYQTLCRYVASLGGRDMTISGPAVWPPVVSALSRMNGWAPRFRALRWVVFPSRAYLAQRGTDIYGSLGYVSAWMRRSRRRLTHQIPATTTSVPAHPQNPYAASGRRPPPPVPPGRRWPRIRPR